MLHVVYSSDFKYNLYLFICTSMYMYLKRSLEKPSYGANVIVDVL